MFIYIVGFSIGVLLGFHTGNSLKPGFMTFIRIKPYLMAMSAPLISFATGYLLTILTFAGLYSSIYRIKADHFEGIPEGEIASFWDFIYLSVTTISTIGLSHIKPTPQAKTAQFLISMEILSGILWVVIYFAAVIAYLQPAFNGRCQINAF